MATVEFERGRVPTAHIIAHRDFHELSCEGFEERCCGGIRGEGGPDVAILNKITIYTKIYD